MSPEPAAGSAGREVSAELGQRIDLVTGRSRPFRGTVLFSSGDAWKGFCLKRQLFPRVERSEAYLADAHLVSVTMGQPEPLEVWWAGQRSPENQSKPNTLNVIPRRVPYRVRYGPVDAVMVLLSSEWFDSSSSPIPMVGAEDPLAVQLVLALAEDTRAGHPFGRLYGESLCAALVTRIGRANCRPMSSSSHRGGLAPNKLRRVVDHIEENLGGPVTLHELANLAQLNVFHFVRAFRQSTGSSPHRYLITKRIARARALLAHSGLTVCEIALECGFANQSHFTSAFRRVSGVTPRQFRQSTQARSADPSAATAPPSQTSPTATETRGRSTLGRNWPKNGPPYLL